MIKIDLNNAENITTEYFSKIKDSITNKCNFYALVFRVLNNHNHEELRLSRLLNGHTKKRLINILLQPARQIQNQTSYSTVLTANMNAWVNNESNVLNNIVEHLKSEQNLKDLILCPAANLFDLSNVLKTRFKATNLVNQQSINRFINSIVDYSILDEISYWLCNEIGIQTCPYCNRIPIHTVIDKKKGIIRGTLDHYYSQNRHPFLALCFYNLIPACYYCNSNLKHNQDINPDRYLHPYVEGFGDDIKFGVFIVSNKPNKSDPENYRIYFRESVSLLSDKKRKAFGNNEDEGNINLFKLVPIYQSHRDWVGEIIVKCDRHSSSQANSLASFLNSLKTSEAEYYQFYFSNYYHESDFHKRPLAKLTKDIVSQVLPLF